MTLAHVQTNFTQKYVIWKGAELNFDPVLTAIKVHVFILHFLVLMGDGV